MGLRELALWIQAVTRLWRARVTSAAVVHTTSVMKPSSVSLVGSRLCFDPSGGAVFAIEADAIAIADLLAGKTHRLPYAHARAITALADQL